MTVERETTGGSDDDYLDGTEPSTPKVPPEILEYIIEYLRDDFEALEACSLVSHICRYLSQRHLFSRIVLYSPVSLQTEKPLSADQFLHTLENSTHISSYVRSLDLQNGYRKDPAFPWLSKDEHVSKLLPYLRNLRKIGVWALGYNQEWSALSSTIKVAISSLCVSGQLTSLELNKWADVPPSFFAQCPSLKHLILTFVDFLPDETSSHNMYHQEPQLETMALFDVKLDRIEEALGHHTRYLQELFVRVHEEEDLVEIQKLLRGCSKSLRYLAMIPYGEIIEQPIYFDFGILSQLRTLSFCLTMRPISHATGLSVLMPSLHNIGPQLQKLILHCRFFVDKLSHKNLSWGDIDDALAADSMKSLQSVTVSIWLHKHDSFINLCLEIEKNLPKLHAKGLLNIVENIESSDLVHLERWRNQDRLRH